MDEGASSHKRFVFLIISFVLVIIAALTVVLTFSLKKKANTPSPSNSANPAAEVENPFSEQAAYDNPFSSDEGEKDYQNPFEQLR